jgi:hypothetical protein
VSIDDKSGRLLAFVVNGKFSGYGDEVKGELSISIIDFSLLESNVEVISERSSLDDGSSGFSSFLS